MAEIHKKTLKNREKQQKTCGNRPFAVDKDFKKPQGKRRWVLSHPHKHRASAEVVDAESGNRQQQPEIAESSGSSKRKSGGITWQQHLPRPLSFGTWPRSSN
jgi:hypothetical protein